MDYRLTISDIKKNLDELRAEGLPLFRFVENIEQTCFSLEDFRDSELCPVEEISTFEADLESHFSRDEDTVCISMTNPNLLYFLMGGNRRIVSDNTYLSRLVNARPSSSKFYDLIISDLVNWKLSTGEDGKQQFMDCRKTGVPVGAVSMIDYIVQENEHIISRFCSHKSQEALRKLLRDYALNICGMESTEPDWAASLKSVPARPLIIMDKVLVKKLAKFLDLSTKMAEVSQDRGEQPKYLAQGLTWLLIAALLRGKLSSMQGDLDRAISSICRVADETGKVITENLDSKITTHKSEFEISQMAESGSPAESLYIKLKDQLEYEQKTHPSFILMNEAAGLDRSLFPKGSLQLRSGNRQAERDEDDGFNNDKTPKTAALSEYIRESWMPGRPRHITIEGEGGIGKTVALLSLATEPGVFPEQVPAIYVRLHRLNLVRVKGKSNNDSSSLLDAYIDSYIKKCGCTGSEAHAFSALCNNDKDGRPQVILLLDGYNEVLDDLKRQVRQAINEWADKPGVQIITTSRTAWSCGDDFLKIKLQPLTEDDIRSYLERTGTKMPSPGDNLWRVINYPLMLTLYSHIEAVQKRVMCRLSPGTLNKEDLTWHPMNKAGDIIWNYLQKELARCAEDMGDRNDLSIEDHAIAILHTAPYIAWRMSRKGWFSIPKEETKEQAVSFLGLIRESFVHLKDEDNWPDQLKQVVSERKRRTWKGLAMNPDLDESINKEDRIADLLLNDINLFRQKDAKIPAKGIQHRNVPEVGIMHQQFRDGLAAIWLCQRIETMEMPDKSENGVFRSTGDKYALPLCWREKTGRYVLKFAAEIMDNKTAERFWEAGRIYQPSDVKFAYTMLNLMSERSVKDGIHQNDFSNLNFNGMDLSDISLFYFRKERSNKLCLPCRSDPCGGFKTNITVNTFKSSGHRARILSVAVTADGKWAVSGGYDGTLRVWDLDNMRCEKELYGHKGYIYSVAVTADGKRAVSGGHDGTVRIWALDDMRCEKELHGHSSYVRSVTVTRDGKWAVSGDNNGTLRVWNLDDMRCEKELPGHSGSVYNIAVTADGKRAVSSSNDGTLRIWDLEDMHCEHVLRDHSGSIFSVAVTENGKRAVSGGRDGIVRVWDLDALCCEKELSGHSGSIFSIAVTGDGKRAVSGGHDGTLRVWNLDDMFCEKALQGHSGYAQSIAVTADGKRAVSGGSDVSVRIWDLDAMLCEKALHGQRNSIHRVAVTGDGKRAVSSSRDRALRIWNLADMRCEKELHGHSSNVRSVAVTRDGKRAVSGDYNGTVRVWNLDDMRCEKELSGHSGSVNSIAVTLDGKRAVSGDYNGTVRIWNLDDMYCEKELPGHSGSVNSIAVTVDGKRAVSGGRDGTVRVWDLDALCCEKVLYDHHNVVFSVAVTEDGKRAVSGGSNGTVRIWDLEGMHCEHALHGHSGSVHSVAVTGDGKRAVSGGRDGTVRIWDLDDMRCDIVLHGHSDYVHSVAITGDGKQAVSGGRDGTVRIWDIDSLCCEKELPGYSGSVNSVAVTGDGKRAVSGGRDGTVIVWGLDSLCCEKTLYGHSSSVHSIAVTVDGKRAVSGSRDGTVRVWNLDTLCCEKTLYGHSGSVHSVAVTADGKRAVSGGRDGTVIVWNLDSLCCEKVLHGHSGWIDSVAVTGDGKRAVSGSRDGTLRIWDLAGMYCEKEISSHSGYVYSIAITGDGKRAVSGGNDGTLRIWDLDSLCCEKTLHGHSGSVHSITVTADGKRAISYSYGTMHIWDLDDMCYEKAQFGHNGDIYSVAVIRGRSAHILDLDALRLEKILQSLPGIDIVGIDLSNAIIGSEEDKEILRQNGAIVC